MNDLPDQSQSVSDTPDDGALGGKPNAPTTAAPAGAKEQEGIRIKSVELPIEGVGHEKELPKEVSDAGVTQRPRTVPVPQAIKDLGVSEVGENVAVPHRPVVAVPLTNEEIAHGLKLDLNSSWRWFAEWCKRLMLGSRQRSEET